jgi:hypothetical protein
VVVLVLLTLNGTTHLATRADLNSRLHRVVRPPHDRMTTMPHLFVDLLNPDLTRAGNNILAEYNTCIFTNGGLVVVRKKEGKLTNAMMIGGGAIKFRPKIHDQCRHCKSVA